MIADSSPWKKSLARDAELIERWARKKASERRSVLIERKLFLAAYSMRKLGDDHRLSTATLATPVSVLLAPATRPGFSNLRHWPDRYFDLQNLVRQQIPWRRVLNLIIHSSVFLEIVDDDEHLEAFMVSSDQEQKRGLVRVELTDFIGLVRTVADDYPTAMRQVWNESKSEWTVWTGHSQPGD